MEQASRDYNMVSKAESAGFIVAFPNGTGPISGGGLATWNAGNCCDNARDNNIDDISFVRTVLGDIQSRYTIDPGRIFSTGMSNGGLLSHRLACEMTDTFRAVAAVAGTDNTISCSPSRPISVLTIHALDDDHVLFNGGAGPDAFRDLDSVTDFTSVPETVNRWISRNQALATPKRVLSVPGAYCDLYSAPGNASHVKLCVTETGSHSWPGGQPVRGKDPSEAIIANDVIWDFFVRESSEDLPSPPLVPVPPPVPIPVPDTAPAPGPAPAPTPLPNPNPAPGPPPAPVPGPAPGPSGESAINDAPGVAQILRKILNFLLSVAGIVGIIGLVVAGFLYLTAYGDEERIRQAKLMLTWSVIGITVVLGALLLVTQIGNLFS